MIDRYLDELEAELRLAADRRLRLTVARAPRPSAGAVSVACALAVCLVVVLTLLQIAPAQRSVGRSGSSASGEPSVPVGARGLVDELAVFRRAQTPADRIDSQIPHLYVLESGVRGGGPQNLTVVPSLTRLVARLPGGRRIFLAIGKVGGTDYQALPSTHFPGSGSRGSNPRFNLPAPHYDVVWLELPFADYVPVPGSNRARMVPVGRGQSMLASPALTASTLLERGPSSVAPEGIPDDPAAALLQGPKTWLDIVPDGVVRARWTIQYPGRPRRVVKTLPVSNNVALLHVPNGQRDEVWSLTWLARDGHAIQTKRYPTAFQ